MRPVAAEMLEADGRTEDVKSLSQLRKHAQNRILPALHLTKTRKMTHGARVTARRAKGALRQALTAVSVV